MFRVMMMMMMMMMDDDDIEILMLGVQKNLRTFCTPTVGWLICTTIIQYYYVDPAKPVIRTDTGCMVYI